MKYYYIVDMKKGERIDNDYGRVSNVFPPTFKNYLFIADSPKSEWKLETMITWQCSTFTVQFTFEQLRHSIMQSPAWRALKRISKKEAFIKVL